MANPHHRKKHKEHLRQFKNRESMASSGSRTSLAAILACVGVVFGLGITYIATNGNLLWIIIAAVACGITGYAIGRNIDRQK